MRKRKMIALTVVAVALLMAWVAPALALDQGKVNINTADVEELMTLERVGEAYARRIVAYRKQNGSFKSAEDILMVKGIGSKILEVNAERIVVTDD
jgi:competence protein ComEA